MGDVPGNGDGRWGGSPIGILSKPPTPKGLCSGMDIGESTIDGGPVLVGGGGGGCRFNLDGMLRASGRADMLPGNGEALLEHPDEPSDEHDELFLDWWDGGDGVPSA